MFNSVLRRPLCRRQLAEGPGQVLPVAVSQPNANVQHVHNTATERQREVDSLQHAGPNLRLLDVKEALRGPDVDVALRQHEHLLQSPPNEVLPKPVHPRVQHRPPLQQPRARADDPRELQHGPQGPPEDRALRRAGRHAAAVALARRGSARDAIRDGDGRGEDRDEQL
eukprot:CAMPEP_0115323628 /NCGR_PEP_ID=MMETSP0270-20121206/82044_1 /TAXON_ID=71861 /ORGANISM="Scrippsiella trochoidea, Strain CCMP3099" /LENGTH=167 /DNA_ID=CAMNT_0002743687 /DNA_START=94 /DNA_END=597 /DNA_ORIENTATION=+